MVHLVEIENTNAVGSEEELKLEHFSFAASGLKQFEDKLTKLEISLRRSDTHELYQAQLNVWDPDGNHIHLYFKLDESS